jgi:hypothetical protein
MYNCKKGEGLSEYLSLFGEDNGLEYCVVVGSKYSDTPQQWYATVYVYIVSAGKCFVCL